MSFINNLNTKTSLRYIKNFNFLNKLFILFIEFYQASLSFFLGGNCRFHPSCSDYSKQAFKEHNFNYALKLTILRVLSCHPLNKKNLYDPVPQKNPYI